MAKILLWCFALAILAKILLACFTYVFPPDVVPRVGSELFPQPFPPSGGVTAVIDGSLVRQYPGVPNGYTSNWHPARLKLKPSKEIRELYRQQHGEDIRQYLTTSWFDIGFGYWDALLTCGPGSGIGCCIELQPEWGELKLSAEMRVTDLVPGSADWCDGRITIQFVDGAGKIVGNRPDIVHAEGTTQWTKCERVYPIPEGAARLNVGLCNFGQSGKVEFKPVSLKVHSLRQPRN